MKTIALDFDGTLLDSRKRHIAVMAYVLEEFGIKKDISDLVQYKSSGCSGKDYLLSRGISEDLAIQIQSRWIELIEEDKFLIKDILYSETISFLTKCKSKGVKTVLITSRKYADKVHEQIDALNLRELLSDVFVVVSGKGAHIQKSRILQTICPNLYVGDTEVDYQAAMSAKVPFLAISHGFRNQAFWHKLNQIPINNLMEINL